VIRLIEVADAPALTALLAVDRKFQAPWDPVRPESYFTEDGQRSGIAATLVQYEAGAAAPYVILDGGSVVGRITVTNIARGPFQSGSLGYWVSQDRNGRGLATAAVGAVARLAFSELGLHRLQADTLVHNVASQRVLERSGFTRIGTAPRYLCIAGRWQDCHLFQLLDEAASESC
jgi:ribosomal-protein-alanine N-acetyltransferase